MGDIEKSRTPFEDFIKSLDKMNGLGANLILVSAHMTIAEELVKKYGLPEDPECINVLNLTEQRWKFLQKFQFPPMFWNFIKVLMWQVATENTQPLDATLAAFMWGFACGQVTEIDPT